MLTAQDLEPAKNSSENSDTCAASPIDHTHLSRYTMGDVDLEREVLALFLDTLTKMTENLNEARDSRDWAEAAHTLKGSSRAVGAWKLAALMENAEHLNPLSGHSRPTADTARRDILTDLNTVAMETTGYIAGLLETGHQK